MPLKTSVFKGFILDSLAQALYDNLNWYNEPEQMISFAFDRYGTGKFMTHNKILQHWNSKQNRQKVHYSKARQSFRSLLNASVYFKFIPEYSRQKNFYVYKICDSEEIQENRHLKKQKEFERDNKIPTKNESNPESPDSLSNSYSPVSSADSGFEDDRDGSATPMLDTSPTSELEASAFEESVRSTFLDELIINCIDDQQAVAIEEDISRSNSTNELPDLNEVLPCLFPEPPKLNKESISNLQAVHTNEEIDSDWNNIMELSEIKEFVSTLHSGSEQAANNAEDCFVPDSTESDDMQMDDQTSSTAITGFNTVMSENSDQQNLPFNESVDPDVCAREIHFTYLSENVPSEHELKIHTCVKVSENTLVFILKK